ncbi:MAG: hypothetical protein JO250_16425 [Armatimonadetes bacterium]|nr:hypothetical protein [Armatimonadota bacterium]
MPDHNRVSRRTFLKAGSALLLATGLPEPAAAAPADTSPMRLKNDLLEAEFDVRGLTAIHDRALGQTVGFADDGFSVALDGATLDSASVPAPTRTQDKNTVTYGYTAGPHVVTVTYELQPSWRFVSKQLSLDVTDGADYHVKSLTPFQATLGTPIAGELLNRGGSYGAFVRFGAGGAPGYGLFFVVQNPFMQWQRTGQRVAISYAPDMDWKPNYGPFPGDRVCLGPYGLTGQGFPTASVPEWQYLPHPERAGTDSPVRDTAEWQALTDCVRAFLLSPPQKSARIHVGWCENDYQIDVATPPGQAEYRRIIDQAAALGCPNILYAPANGALSSKSQSTDAWGWENILWLGLGQKIRKGEWDPGSDPGPPSVKAMQDYAAKREVKLVAYVYPSLKWRPPWNAGEGAYAGANSANREFQDWLIGKLVDFQRKTGVSGYCFDYWWLNYKESSPYAQWYGCRWILESLRERLPDILMDGRQSYQNYGPWTWLAGTYPHPTTTDEQPESFRAFPDLHVDRVYGNRQRWAAWWYRMENFCPTEILPGFLTHQTQRFDAQGSLALTDFRIRDWDYLGWKYSVLSSVATAPMNHVLNFIPARDESEFTHFSAADKKWLRDWLDWTDKNRDILRHVRPILGQPGVGRVDGTAAIMEDHGFVFLFNPNQRAMSAELTLDASMGLTRGETFTLTALHPRPGPVGFGRYGDTLSLLMGGASALVLEIAPFRPKPPLLLNTAGDVSLNGNTLAAKNVTGPIGHDRSLPILVPGGRAVSAVTVNGVPVPFTHDGDTVTARVRFAGTRFDQCQPVGDHDPAFTGGAWRGAFTIPARIFDQLRRRRAAWPIPYTPDDLRATWLGSDRLLLYVQIADPKDDMAVSLTLDGQPVDLQKAYISIYPQAADRTFVGWYLDVSALAPDVPHTVALSLPTLQPGQFQGVFFENVETEYATEVAAA